MTTFVFALMFAASASVTPPRVADVPTIAFFPYPSNAWYQNFIFDLKGETIYAKVSDGHLHRLDIQSGEVVDLGKLVNDDDDGYNHLYDIHPHQNLLLIAGGKDGRSKTIDLLDLKNISVQKTFQFPGRNVLFRDAYFVNDGKQLLVFAYVENPERVIRRTFILVDVATGKMIEKVIPLKQLPEPGFALDTQRKKIAIITDTANSNYFIVHDIQNSFKPLNKISFHPHTVSNVVFTNNNQSFIYFNDFGILNSEIDLGIAMRRFDKIEDDFILSGRSPIKKCAASPNGENMFLIPDPERQMFINLKVGRAIGARGLRNPLFSQDSKLFAAIYDGDGNSGIMVYHVDALNELCGERGVLMPFVKDMGEYEQEILDLAKNIEFQDSTMQILNPTRKNTHTNSTGIAKKIFGFFQKR